MIATLSLRQIAANKLRVLATSFAVVLGVAFLAGTLILTDTIRGTLDNVLAKAHAGTDAYIRGASPLNLGYGRSGRPVSTSLLDTIRKVEGVQRASIEVTGYAQILDKAGKAIGTANGGLLGRNWMSNPTLNPFIISSGRPPAGPNEIAIDKHSADTAKLHVGDHTTVLSKGQPRPATIVGIVRFGSVDTPGALSVVLFDDVTAQAVLNDPGQVDAIVVTAKKGVAPDTLVARLTPIVGVSNEVISGAALTKEHQRQINKDIDQFGTFLTIFALIALFVGAFIINNTFSIIVSQRTKEMAMLRAVGATGSQVRRAVLIEASVTGVVASTIGLAAGIGLAKGLQILLRAVGVDLPLDRLAITAPTAFISIAVGTVITFASAVLPARRASKVAPIAALRDVAQDHSAVSTRRTVTGVVATAAAVAIVIVGRNTRDLKVIGIGSVALFLASSVLGPVLSRPFTALFGSAIARLRGTAGTIARENATRNPTRTARTATSLMIGVALVSFLTLFAASLKASGAQAIRADYHGTLIVDSGAIDGSSGLSPTLARKLKTLPGVRSVAEQRNTAIETDGTPGFLTAYDTATIGKLFDLGRVNGDLTKLGTDGIAVYTEAGRKTVRLGDTRNLTFPAGKSTFTVRATYDHGAAFLGHQFVDLAAFEANLSTSLDARLFIDTDNPTAVEQAAGSYPTAKVLTNEQFIVQQNGKTETILTLMYALLGLAGFIALLGIGNTLALSIHQRKRELGLLRAVGMNRSQVRSSVRWESTIIALFGTGLGLAIGTFLGWAMVGALAHQGTGQLVIPAGPIITVAVIAVAAGIGASILPARRAARVDILTAIAVG